MKKVQLLTGVLAISLGVSVSANPLGQKKPKITKVKTPPKDKTAESAEPDKVLYERAMGDLKRSRYTEARLDLQTLINTYPDSEYLAKAKLGVADSYYKEGGTSNLTQAVEEYKNFIVFFPFLDEAAYAQMQVGMAHYRMTEKADRDNSQAQASEDEFREFLLKYPQSPLVPQAEQYLRNVQEVLADGEFKIARFYYMKQDYRASAARLVEVSSRYPLYSQSDDALSMLGNIYMRAKTASKNEDDKNHWADLAAQCYDRILKDYPLSRLAPEAKARLTAMSMPVPAADPAALARMQKQQLYEREHHPNAVMKVPMGMIKSSPDVYAAAQSGTPNLNPPDDLVSATEVLNQGAAGPSFSVAARGVSTGEGGTGLESPSADSENVPSSDDATPTTAPAAQIVSTGPAADAPSEKVSDNSTAPAADPPANTTVAPAPAASVTSVNASSTNSSSDSATTAQSGQGTSSSSTSQAGTQQQPAAKSDSKAESSSKKKKGLHKLVPF